jgi:hypothetical protein
VREIIIKLQPRTQIGAQVSPMEVVEDIHLLLEETRILSPRTNSNLLLIYTCPPWSSKTYFFYLPLPIHSGHRKNKKTTVLS